jgi:hypothetical protein
MLILMIEKYSHIVYGNFTSKSARVLYQLRMDSICLNTFMQNILYSSLFLFLDSKSQEQNHVIIKNSKKRLIYMDLAPRKMLGFYNSYEWNPQD